MKSYQKIFTQSFPLSLAEVWEFFSSPYNLVEITPEDMAFEVTSKTSAGEKMYPGMIITYKVSPLLGIKLNWMTEITQVEPERYFIDEQRFGPFKFWHHQHHFKEVNGGTEMTDILTYGLPLGILGQMAHGILVENKLNGIFKFRQEKTRALLGTL